MAGRAASGSKAETTLPYRGGQISQSENAAVSSSSYEADLPFRKKDAEQPPLNWRGSCSVNSCTSA